MNVMLGAVIAGVTALLFRLSKTENYCIALSLFDFCGYFLGARFFFILALRPNSGSLLHRTGLRDHTVWIHTHTHTYTHTHTHIHTNTYTLLVGLLCTSDQLDAETSTWQHTTLMRDIHGSGCTRTRSPSKRAVAEPPFRPRGHWHRP
jgi:hypothetical protein